MKVSEEYKWYAREALVTGVILFLIGLLWLGLVTVIPMQIGWMRAAALSLPFFCGGAWSLFVEYHDDKKMQEELRKKEDREETERQRLMSANQK